jgi:hypothetical protein
VVLLVFNKLLRRPWGAPWRVNILAAADALHYELDALPAGATPAEQALRRSVGEAVEHHLCKARKAAWPAEEHRLSVGAQFLDWWTGAPCEAAYANVHEAEIALTQILPDHQIKARIPEALARLQTMDVTDPRRRGAETQLTSDLSVDQRRAAFHSATRIGMATPYDVPVALALLKHQAAAVASRSSDSAARPAGAARPAQATSVLQAAWPLVVVPGDVVAVKPSFASSCWARSALTRAYWSPAQAGLLEPGSSYRLILCWVRDLS